MKEANSMPKARFARLNGTQVEILKLLLNREEENGEEAETSRQQITDLIGIATLNNALGPTWLDNLESYPDSLLARKMVQGATYQKDSGRGMVSYTLTPSGRVAARKYKGRKAAKKEDKIPNEIVDEAVMKVAPHIAYQFELYTDSDMEEIRSKLPKKYQGLSYDLIRMQIVARRKVGAYKKKQEIPEWYQNYRESEHWKERESGALEESGPGCTGVCTINPEHIPPDVEVGVYHKTFSTIGQEDLGDLIVLCTKCRERLAKSLPSIPPTMPGT
jgi:hypothetical protein